MARVAAEMGGRAMAVVPANMLAILPAWRQACKTRWMPAVCSGDPCATPNERARSVGPTRQPSTPSVAMMASTLARPWAVSIWTARKTSSLAQVL